MTEAGDIKAGMSTPWWTAAEDAQILPDGRVTIVVRYPDGGFEVRRFPDRHHQLEVRDVEH